jgi:hypothetical protein
MSLVSQVWYYMYTSCNLTRTHSNGSVSSLDRNAEVTEKDAKCRPVDVEQWKTKTIRLIIIYVESITRTSACFFLHSDT